MRAAARVRVGIAGRRVARVEQHRRGVELGIVRHLSGGGNLNRKGA